MIYWWIIAAYIVGCFFYGLLTGKCVGLWPRRVDRKLEGPSSEGASRSSPREIRKWISAARSAHTSANKRIR